MKENAMCACTRTWTHTHTFTCIQRKKYKNRQNAQLYSKCIMNTHTHTLTKYTFIQYMFITMKTYKCTYTYTLAKCSH